MEQENHWTDNDDLLERFVLNRVTDEERNELEHHLRLCEICKRRVRAEQMLVAGIRRAGRESAKDTLRQRLGMMPQRSLPWGHILSAAAVLLIITSIGIYNRWFEMHRDAGTVVTEHQPAAREEPPTLVTPSQERQDLQKPAAAPMPPPEAQGKGAITEDRDRTDKIVSTPATSPTSSRERELSGNAEPIPSTPLSGEKGEAVARADIAGAPSDVIWIEGTLSRSGKIVADEAPMIAPNRRLSEQTIKKRTNAALQRQAPAHLLISISQQPVSTFPAAQRRQPTTTIPARAERRGDSTHLTLYLDPLLTREAFARITTDTAGDDSLIVHLPDRSVTFVLPPGWVTASPLQPAR